ncbi:MAG TPA: type II toxin-antitoxin system RelE/ParE family toxin [Pirellulales bacterium]|nr:type II toxin-antitoxin system RelE/ParE family toxin [Pirellulales bacterium]
MAKIVRPTLIVASGAWGTVEFAVLQSGRIPAKVFFDVDCKQIREKGADEAQATAQARFVNLFQHMANYGPAEMPDKRFKKEMGNLWAFRHEVANIQIRFPCFRDGNAWIVTHGFAKPGAQKGLGDWPPSEVYRAQSIEAEYRQRKQRPGKKNQ